MPSLASPLLILKKVWFNMIKEIIINSSVNQTRIAIVEDGFLVDFFVDYSENRKMVGDIYLGRVARVLPGIKAAFIDIGMKHDGFLHFSDIGDRTQDLQAMIGEEADDSDADADEDSNGHPKKNQYELINGIPKLQKGQEILVQITKEPVKNKGVRVTSSISIPGRFCVLLPYDNSIGISKKINDFKERKRLRQISRSIIPKNYGLILRTVARNQPESSLTEDLRILLKTWEDIQESVKSAKPPELVYQDVGRTMSVVRDRLTNEVSRVTIDNKKLFKQVKEYLSVVQPQAAAKVELFKSNGSIFDYFKIEERIKSLFDRKVFLKSGGYLIIEHTEAMFVIDVNSGKYAANKDQEMNSLRTDLEAAREIALQLRLRDIGGLVVVDFIDLEDEKNKKKIYDELRKEFRRDRAKVALLPMSDFGLIEITRQRVGQNIVQALSEACPHCQGTGIIVKKTHILYDIEEWLKRYTLHSKRKTLLLKVNPSIAEKLKQGRIRELTKMQFKYFLRIHMVEDQTLNISDFRFYNKKENRDITQEFLS